MATYAIGDIQGCFDPLQHLLESFGFDENHDRLWFVGDLINRGPQSLETLRFVKSLGVQAVTVLGNHDLHLLAIVFGGHEAKRGDTFNDVLRASDCEELADWLRHLPLVHHEADYTMVHAGIPHIWHLDEAMTHAHEVEDAIRGKGFATFFEQMYGNDPSLWDSRLSGMRRYRIITNYFTRMRLVASDGTLDFAHKGNLDDIPEGYAAWFSHPPRVTTPIVFGHWASLDGVTGSAQMQGIDTGCVWGRALTALRLEDGKRFEWRR